MKAIWIIVIFLAPYYIFSQHTITGKITNEKGSPLLGASIIVSGTYDGTITNQKGVFKFKTQKVDSILLICQYIGFETQQIPYLINSDTLDLHIRMKEKFNELEAVVITAGSFEAGDKKKAVLLSALDMITTPGASGNVVNALQYLPGTSNNGESGKLFVRGGSSDESQTYIDGALVQNPYNASAPNTSVRSRFNPFMFEGNVFSTGGFSAEYGEALSSVLLLDTKGMQNEDQLDISILSIGLGLAGTKKWKKTAVTASVDYSNLTPYMKLVPQGIHWNKMPESIESAISFRKKTKKGLWKVYGNYSQTKFDLMDFNIDSQVEDKLNLANKNTYINTSYKGIIGKEWVMYLSGAFTNYIETININSNLFEETTNGLHFKSKFTHSFSKKFKLNTGAEVFTNNYNQQFKSTAANMNQEFSDQHLGSFIEFDWYLSKKLVTRFGGRFDHSTYLKHEKLSPRISMAYKISKNSQMSFAYGQFYQTPKNDFMLYSNKLTFELANHYLLNYSFTRNKRSLKIEAYCKPYKNLVKFNSALPFYDPAYYSNKGNGLAYGIDLFVRDKKTIKNGDYWISYSYLDTKRNYLNFPSTATPRFASKHNISVVYKHWVRKIRTLFGASFSYASPRFFNDPNEISFNCQQMRAYQSLNLNASFLYRENVIFYASATNVLGYKQSYGYEFANTPNEAGVYEKALITPPADRFFIIGCFITLSKTGDKNQLDKIQ
ncbi:TonB-dependent receptor [Putridiphycobacter roseus]|uniref:TonB-dependent receptor n=1 Tax=Putridiphycobacter roseus TaxID=2219161 RepID=A0A2W1NAR0_9FLAO|nr:TonB-dependent receptor [Putridiphycobacter roseus]PZE16123.1 TonB-dependent receptor [Putridiphycobacter roseus]